MKCGHGFGDHSQDEEFARWRLGRDTKWRSCYAQKRLRNAKQGNHLNTIDYNTLAIVSKREGWMSRRKCIHDNELNGKTVPGHILNLVALLLPKFLKRPTNKGRAAVKGKCVSRRVVYGLEIPCRYCFKGDEFSSSQWLKSKLEKQRFS